MNFNLDKTFHLWQNWYFLPNTITDLSSEVAFLHNNNSDCLSKRIQREKREYKENKNNEIQETKMQKQSKEEYAICLKSVIAGVQCGQCKTWYHYRGEGTAKNAN